MKSIFCLITLLCSTLSQAAVPIDGLYTNIFGGYTYMPGNINHLDSTNTYQLNAQNYRGGYNAGGSIGYQSNPMRYEGQITYLKTELDHFNANGIPQTDTNGYGQAVVGMLNVYYDFLSLNPILQPFVGAGIGYGWFQANLNSAAPSLISYDAHNATFAYQGTAGITLNFAENYALNLNYRYVGTLKLAAFGAIFQTHLANATAIYRFDGSKYK
jgi:opacity protein-like surface antigen